MTLMGAVWVRFSPKTSEQFMPRKRKRARRKRKVEITCCVDLTKHEISYSFSLARKNDNFFEGPYWEHVSFELSGTLVDPPNMRGKEIEITVLGSRSEALAVQRPSECRFEPICVGTITSRGDDCSFLGSIPYDALHFIHDLLKNGDTKYLILGGPPLYRGTSEIRSIHFDKVYKREDWGYETGTDDPPTTVQNHE
jgi:hypothetical protein